MPWVMILYVAAFILFVLAALNIPSPPRFNLMAAGLACLVAGMMVAGLAR